MKRKNKLAIFVDVPSLWFSARRFAGHAARVDYDKLIGLMKVTNAELVTAYAYVWDRPGMASFIRALGHIGYTVKLAKLAHPATPLIMADMGEVVKHVGITHIALATGEGDYATLFEKFRQQAVTIDVHAFPGAALGNRWFHGIVGHADCYLGLGGDVLVQQKQQAANE